MKKPSFGIVLLAVAGTVAVTCPPLRSETPRGGERHVSGDPYRAALALKEGITVLSIATEPGFEDLGALSRLAYGRGATVVSAYVTNGEAGESDAGLLYPPQLAAERRLEAVRAMKHLGGDVRFLNFPDFGDASDTGAVRRYWQPDSLRRRLLVLVSDVRPDLILLPAGADAAAGYSPRMAVLLDAVLHVVKLIRPNRAGLVSVDGKQVGVVRVDRVLWDDGTGKGLRFPGSRKDRYAGVRYADLAEAAASEYQTVAVQRPLFEHSLRRSYRVAYPAKVPRIKEPDQHLPVLKSRKLKNLGSQIAALGSDVLRTHGRRLSARSREALLQKNVDLIDSVVALLRWVPLLPHEERRFALRWYDGLEELRCGLLGIRLTYTIDDTVLGLRQLTRLTVTALEGVRDSGSTEFLMPPGTDIHWILNESMERRVPLRVGEPLRLLTPPNAPLNLPAILHGLADYTYGSRFFFMIIHEGKRRTRSFSLKIGQTVLFAPRFAAEVRTPIVRVGPESRVDVKLTNFTHDGVADTLRVSGPYASSPPYPFRLSFKNSTWMDSVAVTWADSVPYGTVLIPLAIEGEGVAQFAARNFPLIVDSIGQLGYVGGSPGSILPLTFSRMGIKWTNLLSESLDTASLAQSDVVVIDHRAMSFRKQLVDSREEFLKFAEQGGRLLILAQDKSVWNAHPFVAGVTLASASNLSSDDPVVADSTFLATSGPNELSDELWDGWLFRRGYHILEGPGLSRGTIEARTASTGAPLLVRWEVGKGSITYINLALQPQLLNIHPGAFALLANLISGQP